MTLRRIMTTGAHELGISLSDEQVDLFLVYLLELEKWNRRINLTAVQGEQDIVVKHFLDSLSFAKGFGPAQDLALLDMGTGAGFPAIPLKIALPGLAVTMVESVKKKASFLRHIVRKLGLEGIEVADRRAEELTASYEERYDVVTARAFSDMERALKAGVRFLRSGGLAVLSRGPSEDISDDAVAAAGYRREQVERLVLPHSTYHRALWVFRKR